MGLRGTFAEGTSCGWRVPRSATLLTYASNPRSSRERDYDGSSSLLHEINANPRLATCIPLSHAAVTVDFANERREPPRNNLQSAIAYFSIFVLSLERVPLSLPLPLFLSLFLFLSVGDK